MNRVFSYPLGLLDELYAFGTKFASDSSQAKFFTEGVGDVDGVLERYDEWVSAGAHLETAPDGLEISPTKVNKLGFEVFDGKFRSPVEDWLPEESKLVHFRVILPQDASPKGVVVVLAMTGDQGYSLRTSSYSVLAKNGYATVLMIAPYYGKRKPSDQYKWYFRTVEDMTLATIASQVDAAQLVQWCRSQWRNKPVCITGLSWGGSMSVGAALLDTGGELACVPFLADSSARAYLNGFLKKQVDFGAVSKTGTDLRRTLGSVSILRLLRHAREHRNSNNSSGPLVLNAVAALDDSVVLPKDANEFYEEIKVVAQRSKLNWVNGGHVYTILSVKSKILPMIREAFAQLEETVS